MSRYERKYRIEGLEYAEVLAIVRQHPLAFREEFPVRTVRNLYLDTPEYDCFSDNLHGIQHRVKYRLRWYGEAVLPDGPVTLELKRKDADIGTKQSYHQPRFNPTDLITPLNLPLLYPSLRNHYRRAYFRSFNGLFRLTIDFQLQFQPPNLHFLDAPAVHDRAVIIELKYPADLDASFYEVGQFLPFRSTKNSKYVTGMLLVGDV